MRVLIVEDETAAYINLKEILKSIDPDIEVAGITESVVQTVRWLTNNHQPDLIFMDIHLSDGSAFNIFSAITVEVPIIFATAYDDYAIDAFRVNSIDYLLKPIEEDAVKRALDKFRKLNRNDTHEYLLKMSKLLASEKYPANILLPVNDKLVPLSLKDIAFFYTTSDHTQVFMNDGRSYSYSKSLDAISQSLDPKCFFRANRQYIIAQHSIKDITIWFDNRLLIRLNLETPERIYISKNRSAEFKAWVISGEK